MGGSSGRGSSPARHACGAVVAHGCLGRNGGGSRRSLGPARARGGAAAGCEAAAAPRGPNWEAASKGAEPYAAAAADAGCRAAPTAAAARPTPPCCRFGTRRAWGCRPPAPCGGDARAVQCCCCSSGDGVDGSDASPRGGGRGGTHVHVRRCALDCGTQATRVVARRACARAARSSP